MHIHMLAHKQKSTHTHTHTYKHAHARTHMHTNPHTALGQTLCASADLSRRKWENTDTPESVSLCLALTLSLYI